MTRFVVRRHPLAAALLAASLASSAMTTLAASPADAPQRLGQTFSIPAGDLGTALNSLAEQAGLAQAFDPAITQGKRTLGLSGHYSLEVAFSRLLSGTGLQAVYVGGTYRLQATPASAGQVTLDSTSIDSTLGSDSPLDDVDGYVAQRSISATKTGTPIHETPQSISVITRERLEAQGVQSVNEALRYTPGFSSYGANNRSDWYSVIRGFSPTIYLDSLQLPTTINLASWMVDPYMLERVEVLRGPAGVLYGQGDPGGVVNQVSKRPSTVAANEIQVQYGTDARRQIAFDSTGPLDDQGVWSYRMVGVLREKNIADLPGHDRRQSLAPSLTFQPDDDTRLTLLASYLYDNNSPDDNFYPAAGTVTHSPFGHIHRDTYTGDRDFQKYEKTQLSFGYEFEKRVNDVWQVRQNLRYSHLDLNDNMVYGIGTTAYAASVYGAGVYPGPVDQRTLVRYAGIENPTYSRWTLDNQVQADFATGSVQHTLLMGLDWQRQHTEDPQAYILTSNLDLFGGGADAPVDASQFTPDTWSYSKQIQRQTGLYLQDQLKFDEHWALTLSGRYDWASASTDSWSTSSSDHASQHDEAFTGRAGLVYLADNGLAPYISYSEGFTPNSGVDYNLKPFDPTRAKQYEAGVKFQPKGSNASVTAAVFDITQTNVLTPDLDATHINSYVQSGEVRSRGFELEGTASLSRELDLIASYTYQDVEITKANDLSKGKTPTSIPVPRNLASVWADYTLREGWLRNLGFGAGVRYVGHSPGSADNSLDVPSYTLLDASAHYTTGPWKLALNVTNLTDHEYISGCYDASRCLFGNPRTAIASATYRW